MWAMFGHTFYSLSTFYCAGNWLFTVCLIFCLNFILHIQLTCYDFWAAEWHGGHLHADKGGKQVQHKPEHRGNNLHAEQGGDDVQLNQEHYGDHLHEKEGEDQVQLNPERHNGHLQGEDSSRG